MRGHGVPPGAPLPSAPYSHAQPHPSIPSSSNDPPPLPIYRQSNSKTERQQPTITRNQQAYVRAASQAFQQVADKHVIDLVNQLLVAENVQNVEMWRDIILRLVASSVQQLQIQRISEYAASKHLSLDPRHYVKIKRIPNTGKPSDSANVVGFIIRKNVAHRNMSKSIENARICLVCDALKCQDKQSLHKNSGVYGIYSLRDMPKDAGRYLAWLRATIQTLWRLKVGIVLCQYELDSEACSMLLERGITAVSNVQHQNMQAIARILGKQATSSIKQIGEGCIGTCSQFNVTPLPRTAHTGRSHQQNNRSTTLMHFVASSPIGNSIILYGDDMDTLAAIKRVTRFAIYSTYLNKLETAYLSLMWSAAQIMQAPPLQEDWLMGGQDELLLAQAMKTVEASTEFGAEFRDKAGEAIMSVSPHAVPWYPAGSYQEYIAGEMKRERVGDKRFDGMSTVTSGISFATMPGSGLSFNKNRMRVSGSVGNLDTLAGMAGSTGTSNTRKLYRRNSSKQLRELGGLNMVHSELSTGQSVDSITSVPQSAVPQSAVPLSAAPQSTEQPQAASWSSSSGLVNGVERGPRTGGMGKEHISKLPVMNESKPVSDGSGIEQTIKSTSGVGSDQTAIQTTPESESPNTADVYGQHGGGVSWGRMRPSRLSQSSSVHQSSSTALEQAAHHQLPRTHSPIPKLTPPPTQPQSDNPLPKPQYNQSSSSSAMLPGNTSNAVGSQIEAEQQPQRVVQPTDGVPTSQDQLLSLSHRLPASKQGLSSRARSLDDNAGVKKIGHFRQLHLASAQQAVSGDSASAGLKGITNENSANRILGKPRAARTSLELKIGEQQAVESEKKPLNSVEQGVNSVEQAGKGDTGSGGSAKVSEQVRSPSSVQAIKNGKLVYLDPLREQVDSLKPHASGAQSAALNDLALNEPLLRDLTRTLTLSAQNRTQEAIDSVARSQGLDIVSNQSTRSRVMQRNAFQKQLCTNMLTNVKMYSEADTTLKQWLLDVNRRKCDVCGCNAMQHQHVYAHGHVMVKVEPHVMHVQPQSTADVPVLHMWLRPKKRVMKHSPDTLVSPRTTPNTPRTPTFNYQPPDTSSRVQLTSLVGCISLAHLQQLWYTSRHLMVGAYGGTGTVGLQFGYVTCFGWGKGDEVTSTGGSKGTSMYVVEVMQTIKPPLVMCQMPQTLSYNTQLQIEWTKSEIVSFRQVLEYMLGYLKDALLMLCHQQCHPTIAAIIIKAGGLPTNHAAVSQMNLDQMYTQKQSIDSEQAEQQNTGVWVALEQLELLEQEVNQTVSLYQSGRTAMSHANVEGGSEGSESPPALTDNEVCVKMAQYLQQMFNIHKNMLLNVEYALVYVQHLLHTHTQTLRHPQTNPLSSAQAKPPLPPATPPHPIIPQRPTNTQAWTGGDPGADDRSPALDTSSCTNSPRNPKRPAGNTSGDGAWQGPSRSLSPVPLLSREQDAGGGADVGWGRLQWLPRRAVGSHAVLGTSDKSNPVQQLFSQKGVLARHTGRQHSPQPPEVIKRDAGGPSSSSYQQPRTGGKWRLNAEMISKRRWRSGSPPAWLSRRHTLTGGRGWLDVRGLQGVGGGGLDDWAESLSVGQYKGSGVNKMGNNNAWWVSGDGSRELLKHTHDVPFAYNAYYTKSNRKHRYSGVVSARRAMAGVTERWAGSGGSGGVSGHASEWGSLYGGADSVAGSFAGSEMGDVLLSKSEIGDGMSEHSEHGSGVGTSGVGDRVWYTGVSSKGGGGRGGGGQGRRLIQHNRPGSAPLSRMQLKQASVREGSGGSGSGYHDYMQLGKESDGGKQGGVQTTYPDSISDATPESQTPKSFDQGSNQYVNNGLRRERGSRKGRRSSQVSTGPVSNPFIRMLNSLKGMRVKRPSVAQSQAGSGSVDEQLGTELGTVGGKGLGSDEQLKSTAQIHSGLSSGGTVDGVQSNETVDGLANSCVPEASLPSILGNIPETTGMAGARSKLSKRLSSGSSGKGQSSRFSQQPYNSAQQHLQSGLMGARQGARQASNASEGGEAGRTDFSFHEWSANDTMTHNDTHPHMLDAHPLHSQTSTGYDETAGEQQFRMRDIHVSSTDEAYVISRRSSLDQDVPFDYNDDVVVRGGSMEDVWRQATLARQYNASLAEQSHPGDVGCVCPGKQPSLAGSSGTMASVKAHNSLMERTSHDSADNRYNAHSLPLQRHQQLTDATTQDMHHPTPQHPNKTPTIPVQPPGVQDPRLIHIFHTMSGNVSTMSSSLPAHPSLQSALHHDLTDQASSPPFKSWVVPPTMVWRQGSTSGTLKHLDNLHNTDGSSEKAAPNAATALVKSSVPKRSVSEVGVLASKVVVGGEGSSIGFGTGAVKELSGEAVVDAHGLRGVGQGGEDFRQVYQQTIKEHQGEQAGQVGATMLSGDGVEMGVDSVQYASPTWYTQPKHKTPFATSQFRKSISHGMGGLTKWSTISVGDNVWKELQNELIGLDKKLHAADSGGSADQQQYSTSATQQATHFNKQSNSGNGEQALESSAPVQENSAQRSGKSDTINDDVYHSVGGVEPRPRVDKCECTTSICLHQTHDAGAEQRQGYSSKTQNTTVKKPHAQDDEQIEVTGQPMFNVDKQVVNDNQTTTHQQGQQQTSAIGGDGVNRSEQSDSNDDSKQQRADDSKQCTDDVGVVDEDKQAAGASTGSEEPPNESSTNDTHAMTFLHQAIQNSSYTYQQLLELNQSIQGADGTGHQHTGHQHTGHQHTSAVVGSRDGGESGQGEQAAQFRRLTAINNTRELFNHLQTVVTKSGRVMFLVQNDATDQYQPIIPEPVVIRDAEPTSMVALLLCSNIYTAQLYYLRSKILANAAMAIHNPPRGDGAAGSVTPSAQHKPEAQPGVDGAEETQDQLGGGWLSESEKLAALLKCREQLHITQTFQDLFGLFHSSTCSVTVTEYYAPQFAALRELLLPQGVGGEQLFVSTLLRCAAWDAKGGRSRVKFSKSGDDVFVIKQLRNDQRNTLLKMAPTLINHFYTCTQNEQHIALVKVFGFFTVTVRHHGTSGASAGPRPPFVSSGLLKPGEEFHFIIMENLFYGRDVDIYDLKGTKNPRHPTVIGATTGAASGATSAAGIGDITHAPGGGGRGVRNDMYLTGRLFSHPLMVDSDSLARIQSAMRVHTDFLAGQMVMDYSLLVGIDKKSSKYSNPTAVVGIIDYLSQYTWNKKLESWVKLTIDGAQRSITTPAAYQERFLKGVMELFHSVPVGVSTSNEQGQLDKHGVKSGNSDYKG